MALFSLGEIFDIIIMIAAVGFIFSDTFGKLSRKVDYEPLIHYRHGFDLEAFKFAIYVTAPVVILHEFGHKFTALALGLSAEFHAAYLWLLIGVGLKLFGFPYIFFVPAFVSISGGVSPLAHAMTSFAGPLVNLSLWLLALLAIKMKWLDKKYDAGLHMTSKINMFLFIFNMLPIPGFDGNSFFLGLWQAFF